MKINSSYFKKEYDLSKSQLVGEGNFAQVYRIYDNDMNDFLAIRKVLKSQAQYQDLSKEKIINQELMRVQNQNILKIYDIIDSPQYIWYITEYCQGGSLWYNTNLFRDALNHIKDNKMKQKDAMQCALQISKGVQELHNHRITHRDLKPQNILLKTKYIPGKPLPTVKLADFGLSTKKIIMETIAGTKQYIAPQQAKFQNYTNAVDVWSLGIICDEVLHGTPFYSGDNNKEVFNKILKTPYKVRDQTIRQSIQQFLISLLKKKPYQRPIIAVIRKNIESIIQQIGQQKVQQSGNSKIKKNNNAFKKNNNNNIDKQQKRQQTIQKNQLYSSRRKQKDQKQQSIVNLSLTQQLRDRNKKVQEKNNIGIQKQQKIQKNKNQKPQKIQIKYQTKNQSKNQHKNQHKNQNKHHHDHDHKHDNKNDQNKHDNKHEKHEKHEIKHENKQQKKQEDISQKSEKIDKRQKIQNQKSQKLDKGNDKNHEKNKYKIPQKFKYQIVNKLDKSRETTPVKQKLNKIEAEENHKNKTQQKSVHNTPQVKPTIGTPDSKKKSEPQKNINSPKQKLPEEKIEKTSDKQAQKLQEKSGNQNKQRKSSADNNQNQNNFTLGQTSSKIKNSSGKKSIQPQQKVLVHKFEKKKPINLNTSKRDELKFEMVDLDTYIDIVNKKKRQIQQQKFIIGNQRSFIPNAYLTNIQLNTKPPTTSFDQFKKKMSFLNYFTTQKDYQIKLAKGQKDLIKNRKKCQQQFLTYKNQLKNALFAQLDNFVDNYVEKLFK